jgi:hypothetical protein
VEQVREDFAPQYYVCFVETVDWEQTEFGNLVVPVQIESVDSGSVVRRLFVPSGKHAEVLRYWVHKVDVAAVEKLGMDIADRKFADIERKEDTLFRKTGYQ